MTVEDSMSSLVRVARSGALVSVLAVVSACGSARSHSETAVSPGAKLSETERITHVLSRLTFGARPGDVDRIAAMGVNRWIDRQLRPESIPDSGVVVALASIPPWAQPTQNIAALTAPPRPYASVPMTTLMKDTAARAALTRLAATLVVFGNPNDLFAAGKVVRAQTSERQLLEVVSDFWENHFSVYSGKMPSREALIVLDRDVLRPHAFGKFRDLLGAVAHSPAMLYYLDNHLSTSRGLNENYARELLELHTLGVDGGYTQQDVIEVARALTGWSFTPSPNPSSFQFRQERHDTGSKMVLGHRLQAGRGIEDGEEVLDILARHPSTAHYISLKLARRLVSDDPPPALVDRAAETFRRTDGDIAQVVRTIVKSPEFFSRAAFRAKVKTPFEFVVSARRAVSAPVDTTPTTARGIAQLGQPIFGRLTPDGWPDKGVAWMNSGTLYNRIKFTTNLAAQGVPSLPPDRWHDWSALAELPIERQIDAVVKDVLGGTAELATRDAMLAVRSETMASAAEGRRRLRELLTIAMASPEFQRR
jgi:uncharacterized protein (DUF1800 family)